MCAILFDERGSCPSTGSEPLVSERIVVSPLEAEPDGLDTGLAIARPAHEATAPGDEMEHILQRRWGCRERVIIDQVDGPAIPPD